MLAGGAPAEAGAYYQYRSDIRGRFLFEPGELPDAASLAELMGAAGRTRTVEIADDFASGRFLFFSKQTFDLGLPPNWLLNPMNGGRHENRTHWCDYPTFSPARGDIKDVWEPSRFACAYWLARAYAVTRDETYPRAFWVFFESWCEQNPPNRGPNWKCGQETAIRIFAWCFALHAFWRAEATTPQRVAAMVRAIAMQARRIAGNIDYAISQKNNHGISEAVGLLTVGLLFPELKGADQWRQTGRALFEQEVLRQIYADGAFVQHSMNYHRVMLHDCLWAIRLADRCGEKISPDVRKRVEAAGEFLFQMHDATDGRVPNYGPNDGALLLPLDSCDYQDFRPAIQAAGFLATGQRMLQRGPWDESLLWLFGAEALNAPVVRRLPESKRFDDGGYYTLRRGDTWCMVRCHTYRDRPSHVDMLHLDLWHRGANIFGDSGTYKYFNAESPALERYFKDIAAHNTIEIDGRGPLDLFSRFIWLPWPRARCVEHQSDRWQGDHYGYNRPPWRVAHHRKVRVVDDSRWEIGDDLSGQGLHQVALRWHLPDVPYTFEREAGRLTLELPGGQATIEIEGPAGLALDVQRGTEGARPMGWTSLYYAEILPRPTLVASGRFQFPLHIVTTISFR